MQLALRRERPQWKQADVVCKFHLFPCLAVLTYSCSSTLYYPPMVNVPAVREEGDFELNSGGSFLRECCDNEDAQRRAFEVAGNYVFHHNFLAGMSLSGSIPEYRERIISHLSGDFGIGAFKNINKWASAGLILGAGYGETDVTVNNISYSEIFYKIFGQPYLFMEWKWIGLAYSLKSGLLIESGQNVREHTLTFRVGYDQVKFYFQYGIIFINPDVLMESFNGGLSIRLSLFNSY